MRNNHPSAIKVREKKPFLPPVSLEQFLAIESGKPETYSGNELVDAVAIGFQTVKPFNARILADYMELDAKKLASAMEILTGHSIAELRYHWVKDRLERLEKLNPKPKPGEIARELGFLNANSLWQFVRSDGYKAMKRVNLRKDWYTEYKSMKARGLEPRRAFM